MKRFLIISQSAEWGLKLKVVKAEHRDDVWDEANHSKGLVVVLDKEEVERIRRLKSI
jgi:hypothetical protein